MAGKKKYIALPNDYLSYSQWSLWKTSPERYAELYFDRRDELRFSNAGQDYGKIVADALERGEETGDVLTDSAMLLLPKYDIADVAINTEFKTPYGWLKLIGKPDSMDSETKKFLEFKTGVVPWTLKKAQKHPQMPFYAIVIGVAYGVWNEDAILAWIETERLKDEETGKLSTKPTGRVESFTVKFTRRELLEFQADIVKVAHEIELAWASHVTNPELVNF